MTFSCTWGEGSSALLWLVVRRLSSVVGLSSLTFHIFDFSSETPIQNSTKLDLNQDLNVIYHICVFMADGKTEMAAPASDWLWHFYFFSETDERDSTKHDRKQDIDVLYQVCALMPIGKSSWPLRPLISWDIFDFLLWKRSTDFDETWQEARSEWPLASFCFSSRSENPDGRLGFWLAETFSTSPLKLLNEVQRNLTESKISTSSTKFVFLGLVGKQRWSPWPWLT